MATPPKRFLLKRATLDWVQGTFSAAERTISESQFPHFTRAYTTATMYDSDAEALQQSASIPSFPPANAFFNTGLFQAAVQRQDAAQSFPMGGETSALDDGNLTARCAHGLPLLITTPVQGVQRGSWRNLDPELLSTYGYDPNTQIPQPPGGHLPFGYAGPRVYYGDGNDMSIIPPEGEPVPYIAGPFAYTQPLVGPQDGVHHQGGSPPRKRTKKNPSTEKQRRKRGGRPGRDSQGPWSSTPLDTAAAASRMVGASGNSSQPPPSGPAAAGDGDPADARLPLGDEHRPDETLAPGDGRPLADGSPPPADDPPSDSEEYRLTPADFFEHVTVGVFSCPQIVDAFRGHARCEPSRDPPPKVVHNPWKGKANANEFRSTNYKTACVLKEWHLELVRTRLSGAFTLGSILDHGCCLELCHITLTRERDIIDPILDFLNRIVDALRPHFAEDVSPQEVALAIQATFCKCLNSEVLLPHAKLLWEEVLPLVREAWKATFVMVPTTNWLPFLSEVRLDPDQMKHRARIAASIGIGINVFCIADKGPRKSQSLKNPTSGSNFDVARDVLRTMFLSSNADAKEAEEKARSHAPPDTNEAGSSLRTEDSDPHVQPSASIRSTNPVAHDDAEDTPASKSSMPTLSLLEAMMAFYPDDCDALLEQVVNDNGVRVLSFFEGRLRKFLYDERPLEHQHPDYPDEGEVAYVRMFSDPLFWWFVRRHLVAAIKLGREGVLAIYLTLVSPHSSIEQCLEYIHQFLAHIGQFGTFPADIDEFWDSASREVIMADSPRVVQTAFLQWSRDNPDAVAETLHARKRMLGIMQELLTPRTTSDLAVAKQLAQLNLPPYPSLWDTESTLAKRTSMPSHITSMHHSFWFLVCLAFDWFYPTARSLSCVHYSKVDQPFLAPTPRCFKSMTVEVGGYFRSRCRSGSGAGGAGFVEGADGGETT
ncbi:hypothetical protein DFP72DRAFT_845322 [Ephemerocybe angulata]|uniref:Uncharacterized protein n=1 Tax=Ephemerocybe angulata TaxID=980116 RepID=A0A8H6I464_9AGAR|nr:hypothetical protein DFP72DRAFT_845322 [Tulosesus angulatus]